MKKDYELYAMIVIPSLTDFSQWGDHIRLALKIHERGEVSVKTRRHVFVPKVRMEEHIMAFLRKYVEGKKN